MTSPSRPRTARRAARVAVGFATAGAVAVLTALPASAHVEISEGEAAAGSEATVTFGIGHGCEGQATTKVRISLPDSLIEAKPTLNANWDIQIVNEPLSSPVTMEDGDSIDERVKEVDFTAKTPLPDAFTDHLQLNITVPEDAAGTTLYFPTIQECGSATTEWTKLPAKGQDPEELDTPAPSLVITEASAEGDHHGGEASSGGDTMSSTTAAGDAAADSKEETSTSDDSNGLAIGGLVAGIGGLLLGGAAFARSRPSAS